MGTATFLSNLHLKEDILGPQCKDNCGVGIFRCLVSDSKSQKEKCDMFLRDSSS